MKYYHFPGIDHKGGCTIAYEFEKTNNGKRLVFSVGFCSHKDQYVKQKGRDAALKQWAAGNKLSIICKTKQNRIFFTQLSINFLHIFDSRIA